MTYNKNNRKTIIIYDYDYIKASGDKFDNSKVPIFKGCKNESCYCTGKCKEIIGFRDKFPGEEIYKM